MEYIAIFISIIIGILLGMITGLTPGIHINLVISIILAYSYLIIQLTNPLNIIITMVAMATTHTIFDAIPSTILGIPDSDNLTMLLPAHK